jgi:membrane protein required for colicin V production
VNGLDVIILICAVAGLIRGLFSGFIKQAVSLAALVIAIFFSGQMAAYIRPYLEKWFNGGFSSAIIGGLVYILAFVAIIVIICLIGKLISFAIKMTPAKPLNTLLGGLFGMFIWVLSLSLILNVLSIFDLQSQVISSSVQNKSVFYSRVKAVVPTIYPVLKHYFEH